MINTYANYMRLVKELEQEQTSHAETRKLLLKACLKRDDQRIDDYRSGYSCGWNDHLHGKVMRDQAAAAKYLSVNRPAPEPAPQQDDADVRKESK